MVCPPRDSTTGFEPHTIAVVCVMMISTPNEEIIATNGDTPPAFIGS